MEKFNLQKAKSGGKVTTVMGHKVRILTFDRRKPNPIVALVDNGVEERVLMYNEEGETIMQDFALRMAEPEKPGQEKPGQEKPGQEKPEDPVNSPKHYTSHPSGVECIHIAEHYNFCIGNAIKYLWRHGLKSSKGLSGKEKSIQDLEKAVWYINREIENLKKQ